MNPELKVRKAYLDLQDAEEKFEAAIKAVFAVGREYWINWSQSLELCF